VLGPYLPYFPSMYERISLSDLPSALRSITSRVMLRQMFQVAAWLVKVMRPSSYRF